MDAAHEKPVQGFKIKAVLNGIKLLPKLKMEVGFAGRDMGYVRMKPRWLESYREKLKTTHQWVPEEESKIWWVVL